MRINRFIATAGVSSRRKADELILAGRVQVNNVTIKSVGINIDPENDVVEVDGEKINVKKSKTYLMFHKPLGVISSMSDPQGRSNLNDYFGGKKDRIFHVGRLDKDSEGLLLLTNDGDFAHHATHPSFGAKKRYLVLVEGEPSNEIFGKIRSGVKLEDGMVKADSVKRIGKERQGEWIEIEVHEGRNQIIRRLFKHLGFKVVRLVRINFAGLELGDLKPGRFRAIQGPELTKLFQVLKLKK